jgi:large subunit ribosomal protein L4
MAILSKLQDNEAIILDDDLQVAEIKTKPVADLLKTLKLKGTSCLIGTAAQNPTLYKSARNIQGVIVAPAAEFNAYTVLKQKRLLLTKSALEVLRKKAAAPAQG